MKTRINTKMYMMIAMLLAMLSLNGFSKDDQEPTITKTFDLNQPGTLNASSSGGGVVVQTHEKEEVVIQAFVRKRGKLLSPSDSELDELLDAFELDFSKRGSVITAKVERKSHMNFWNNVGISLTITVPREMSCNVSSSGGGLKISGVEGNHEFSSSGGGVQLENVSGTTEARSSGGGVKVTNQNGDVHLSSSGGRVTVDDAHGSVYARSSGGSVDLNNIHGDVDASSSGGGVSVTGEAAYVKAKSSGGSVHIDIRNLSKELYLNSSGGGIDAIIHNGDELGLDLDLSSDRV
ncbi:MAG: hypothetical protein JW833_07475, partial [Prolixibacteraceae bacterium]|nr:hypothetical protein [Prolixibacteraceae bacterium]